VLYRSFILRLQEVHRDNLVTLDYIPGSFTSRQATELLDVGTEAMTKQFALKPIRDRHMLRDESDSRRFNIQGILREVIRANFAIKNMAEIKSRYSRLYSRVITDIAQKMGTAEYTKAIAEFSVEQPNLRKLLREVHDTKQDDYHFFIEMASCCTEVIEKYMADQSDSFYGGCLELAHKYGKDKDKVSVYIAVGSVETLTKGNLQVGEKNYLKALNVLKKHQDKTQLAVVYKKMGWNAFKQGLCTQAVEFCQKSLGIYQLDTDEYEVITLENLSIMALACNVLGEFDSAEKYHKFCLMRRERRFGPKSAVVGKTLNNMGLLFARRGNHQKAFEFYMRGLKMKRESHSDALSIVYSLSNVADCLSNMGKYDEAHEHLDEAYDILSKERVPMLDGLSLIHHTKGKVFANEDRLKEACNAFSESVKISRMSELKGFVWMERLIDLARSQRRRTQYKDCIDTLTEALSFQEEISKSMEHSFDIIKCFNCLSEVYRETGDQTSYVRTLYSMEKECFRLEQVCKKYGNNVWTEEVQRYLDNTQTEIRRLDASAEHTG
ncbi:KLC-like protein, partial [Mya arenaria]